MQGFTLGAGLAALAFWGFIAAVVVSGVWFDIRKREAQHETVRRIIESGKPIDDELMDKLLSLGSGKAERLDRGFKITGFIMIPASVGLALFGLIMGTQFPDAELPLLGAAALVGCLGLGFLVLAQIVKRWYLADNETSSGVI